MLLHYVNIVAWDCHFWLIYMKISKEINISQIKLLDFLLKTGTRAHGIVAYRGCTDILYRLGNLNSRDCMKLIEQLKIAQSVVFCIYCIHNAASKLVGTCG